VGRWLSANGLEQYISNFTFNGVTTPDVIIALTEKDLQESLAITNFGDRKRIHLAVKKLRKDIHGSDSSSNSDDSDSSRDEGRKKKEKPKKADPSPPIMMNNLPQQQQQHTSSPVSTDFAGGVCSCLSDINTCLCSFICPCIQFGLNAAELHRRTGRDGLCCGGSAVGACIGCFLVSGPLFFLVPPGPILSCVYRLVFFQAPFRTELTRYAGIPSDCCSDCCIPFALPCLAIAQEARVLKQK